MPARMGPAPAPSSSSEPLPLPAGLPEELPVVCGGLLGVLLVRQTYKYTHRKGWSAAFRFVRSTARTHGTQCSAAQHPLPAPRACRVTDGSGPDKNKVYTGGEFEALGGREQSKRWIESIKLQQAQGPKNRQPPLKEWLEKNQQALVRGVPRAAAALQQAGTACPPPHRASPHARAQEHEHLPTCVQAQHAQLSGASGSPPPASSSPEAAPRKAERATEPKPEPSYEGKPTKPRAQTQGNRELNSLLSEWSS